MTEPLQRGGISEAFALAVVLHARQTRKGSRDEKGAGIPYIAHLMSVAALILEHGGSEEEAIAGLLHDGPEDQGGQPILDQIERRFGSTVEAIVRNCSDTLEAEKPCWLPRKQAYLKHLEESAPRPGADSLFLVSLADKVHNVGSILADYRSIGCRVWDRFNQRRDGTLWYYHALLKVYQDEAPGRCKSILAEYERLLKDLDDLARKKERVTEKDWHDFDTRPATDAISASCRRR